MTIKNDVTKTNGYWKMGDKNKNVTKMGIIIKGVYCNCLEQVVCNRPCENLIIIHNINIKIFHDENQWVWTSKFG